MPPFALGPRKRERVHRRGAGDGFVASNRGRQTSPMGRYAELCIVQCRASFDWRARRAHAAARDGVARAR